MMRILLVLIPFIVAKRVAIVSDDLKSGTEELESGGTEKDYIDCVISTKSFKGKSGLARFAIPANKCYTRCIAQVDVQTDSGRKSILQQDRQFPRAFRTYYVRKTGKCVCKVSDEPRVEFNPNGEALAAKCEANDWDAKRQCWETYQKIAALNAVVDGSITTFHSDPKFDFGFEIQKTCEACPNKDCETASLPPLTSYLTDAILKILAQQIEEKKTTGNLTGILAMFDESYTDEDKANLKWTIHDTNEDGFLDRDELIVAYPDVSPQRIDLIISKIDTDGDGQVNQAEFPFFHKTVLSIWTFSPTDNPNVATLHCVFDFKDTGVCETTLEQEISKANTCIN
jgi:hypothetical protein